MQVALIVIASIHPASCYNQFPPPSTLQLDQLRYGHHVLNNGSHLGFTHLHGFSLDCAIIAATLILSANAPILIWPYRYSFSLLIYKFHKRCVTAGNGERDERPCRSVKRKLDYNTTQDGTQASSSSDVSKNDQKGDMNDEPPQKRGRKRAFHDGESCGDCSVWLTLGADAELKSHHVTNKYVQHPNENARLFTEYLSTES